MSEAIRGKLLPVRTDAPASTSEDRPSNNRKPREKHGFDPRDEYTAWCPWPGRTASSRDEPTILTPPPRLDGGLAFGSHVAIYDFEVLPERLVPFDGAPLERLGQVLVFQAHGGILGFSGLTTPRAAEFVAEWIVKTNLSRSTDDGIKYVMLAACGQRDRYGDATNARYFQDELDRALASRGHDVAENGITVLASEFEGPLWGQRLRSKIKVGDEEIQVAGRFVPAREAATNRELPAAGPGLWFDVRPEDADVFIDDVYIGRVNDLVDHGLHSLAQSGVHRIRIAKDGYHPFTTEVAVQDGLQSVGVWLAPRIPHPR